MHHFPEFIINHWMLFAALALILSMLIGSLLVDLGGGTRTVATAEAIRLINREDAVILDVRGREEYNRGHILSALNVPEALLDEKLGELGKYRERAVLIYYAASGASGRAGKALKKAGFTKLFTLKGGIASWEQENLPLTRE